MKNEKAEKETEKVNEKGTMQREKE